MSERSAKVNLPCFKAYTLDDSLEKAKQSVTALRDKAKESYKMNCKVLDEAIRHMDAEFSQVFPDGNESAPLHLAAQVQQMEDKRQLIALLSCNQLNNIEQHISIQLRDMIMDVKESNGLLAPPKIEPDPAVVKLEKEKNKITKGTLEAMKQPTTPPCSVEQTLPNAAKKEPKTPVKPAAKKPEKKRASFTNGIRKMRDNIKTRRAEKKRKEALKEKEKKNESKRSTEEQPKNRVQLLRPKTSVNVTTPVITKTPVNLNCTTPESSVKQVEEVNNVAHTPPPQSSPRKTDARKNAKPWYQLW